VWVHRYRDVEPKIRADCIRKLGDWISEAPAIFFDGAFLRYLGWVLSDLSGNCRLETVRALQKIYENKDCTGGLRGFTERFRSRLVEMATLDSDVHVRAAAVELLDVIREIGYLEPSDVEEVGKMLFDSEPKVRKAVMGFFVKTVEDEYDSKVEDLGGVDALEQFDVQDDNAGVKLSWLRLKCLVESLAGNESDTNEDEDNAENQDIADKEGVTGAKISGWDSRISLAGEVLWEGFEEVQVCSLHSFGLYRILMLLRNGRKLPNIFSSIIRPPRPTTRNLTISRKNSVEFAPSRPRRNPSFSKFSTLRYGHLLKRDLRTPHTTSRSRTRRKTPTPRCSKNMLSSSRERSPSTCRLSSRNLVLFQMHFRLCSSCSN
jgi:hypothetical protein